MLTMNINDGLWNCEICKEKGNLIHLNRILLSRNEMGRSKLYSPNYERKAIRRLFSRIGCKDDEKIKILRKKIDDFMAFYLDR